MIYKAAIAKPWNHASKTFDNIFLLDDLRLKESPLLNTLLVDIIQNDILFDRVNYGLEMGNALLVLA